MLLRKCIREFPLRVTARALTSKSSGDPKTGDVSDVTSNSNSSPVTAREKLLAEKKELLEKKHLAEKRTKVFDKVSSLCRMVQDHQDVMGTDMGTETLYPLFDKFDDFFDVKSLFTLRDLFDNKVHMGHHIGCWHSPNKDYLYGIRNNMHIIDIANTEQHLWRALNVISHVAYAGGSILFVNNKPPYKVIVKKAAETCGEPTYTRATFRTREFQEYTVVYKAVEEMERKPDLVICTSCSHPLAKELLLYCNKYLIPTIGVMDSDVDPVNLTYVIPGNDDSTQSINLYHQLFAKAIVRAKKVALFAQEDKKRRSRIRRKTRKVIELY